MKEDAVLLLYSPLNYYNNPLTRASQDTPTKTCNTVPCVMGTKELLHTGSSSFIAAPEPATSDRSQDWQAMQTTEIKTFWVQILRRLSGDLRARLRKTDFVQCFFSKFRGRFERPGNGGFYLRVKEITSLRAWNAKISWTLESLKS